ncbi:MAG: hypothetical protein AUI14_04940 [Actinobacteria bacterium 13_2_20CM_2_71_6]|nr:MAG: hypothetical protein AUI14_04940 [Actinobacteria bacterium 13_2_20CM_2_71_6]
MAAVTACGPAGATTENPGLAPRGTTMTTVKPSRQDLANKVSLSGKVTIGPVFGLVSPVAGQVRYVDVKPPQSTPTKPTRVATVVAGGKSYNVDVPAGAVFSGRLVDDRSTVTAGMPIVSAKYVGYGIVADIDGAQAYKISDALGSVQAQLKNGPGPFACTVLGTIAALPAGTIPDPPATQPSTPPNGGPQQVAPPDKKSGTTPSDPTGLRLVCTAPADVKLINGASATLELVTEKAVNVLVLPVEAVAGLQGNGKVDVVKPDGTKETRDVVLGLTDGKVVQIKSGLTGDETIAVPGPNLAPAKPNDNNGGPGGPDGPTLVPGTK